MTLPADRETPVRHPSLDWLKCLSIVAVVVTHAGYAALPGVLGWTRSDTIFRHLLASFHVPCLLMVSGYLYYRPHPIGWSETARRLRRILLPYIAASIVVFSLRPELHASAREKLLALLFADALPIYYYVFLLTVFVLLLPWLSRLSNAAQKRLFLAVVVAFAVLNFFPGMRGSLEFFWAVRNPFETFALGYFLVGWIAAAAIRAPSTLPRLQYASVLLLACAWPACVAAGSPYPAILVAKIPFALAVWFTAWRYLEGRPAPAPIRWISDATYGLFLYHYLAIYPFFGVTGPWLPPFRIAALTAAGLGGGLAIGICLRKVFGTSRAREWFGY